VPADQASADAVLAWLELDPMKARPPDGLVQEVEPNDAPSVDEELDRVGAP
jgi:hypothetical protein